MLHLAWPWLLLALPLPWLMARWLPPAPRVAGEALRLPFFAQLGAAADTAAAGPRRRLGLLVWLLLVLAAARPQWLGEPVPVPTSARDLMLAVDVSGSMERSDYQLSGRAVTRLQVVKRVAGEFIERREGDRIGLILFGSRAYLQTPITHDRATVAAMLDQAVIGLAGRETALGDAIAIAVKRLREQPEQQRVLVLLTDGANTAGSIAPIAAADIAAEANLRIYTVGIGSGDAGRGPFGMLGRGGGDLDLATLEAIAERTGGRAFQASNTAELQRIYAELDQLEPRVGEAQRVRPRAEVFQWPAGLALLLSMLLAWEQGGAARRGGRRGEAGHVV